MRDIFFLVVFIFLSSAFAMAAIVAGFVCAAKCESDEKSSTYECGMKIFKDANIQFDIKFLNYAIMFLIFDVETIFLFPFAVCFVQLGKFAVFEAIIFVLLILCALFFAIDKNILRWE